MLAAVAALGFVFSTAFRYERFTAFLDITGHRDKLSYQTYQGFLSIADGGLTGSGVGAGNGKLGYLPLAHSDFIFAVIADELGFVGSVAVVGGFMLLVWFGIQAALAAPDRFGMLLAGGISAWFGVQAVINLGRGHRPDAGDRADPALLLRRRLVAVRVDDGRRVPAQRRPPGAIDAQTARTSPAMTGPAPGVTRNLGDTVTAVVPIAPPTPPLDLSRPLRLHVVGVGGPGMSAIAIALAEMGHDVSGSDLREQTSLDRVRAAGVTVHVGHDPSVIEGCDAVTSSTAIPASNVELLAAGRLGIPTLRRAGMLAAICARARSVAVAGTHGKTTTTSMLMLILADGWPGAELRGRRRRQRCRDRSPLDGRRVARRRGRRERRDAHRAAPGGHDRHQRRGRPSRSLRHVRRVDRELRALPRPDRRSEGALRGRSDLSSTWPTATAPRPTGWPPTPTYGRWTSAPSTGRSASPSSSAPPVADTSGSAMSPCRCAACTTWSTRSVPSRWRSTLGVPFTTCAGALARFGGVARRFDIRGVDGGATFVDDYAHLPTEIAVVIAAARDSGDGWSRVIVAFQPNRFNRIVEMWRDYADAFVGADVVVITDVYASGTTPIPGVTGKLIVNAVLDAHPLARVLWLPRREDMVSFLAGETVPGDVCISMGCGDIATLPEEILARRAILRSPDGPA